jgi:glycosyltransferase involved in cell wall biosynthesis
MKKRIWIINKHLRPPKYETHFRYIKYAEYLSESGHEIRLICSAFQHQTGINLIPEGLKFLDTEFEGNKFTLIKTLSYKRNGVKRLYSLIQFTSRAIKYIKKARKPDVIIHTSNTPFTNRLGQFAKRRKILYVAEILDLWPESFVSFGLLSSKNPLLALAYNMEKRLYARADIIVFSMEGGIDYIKNKKWDKQYNNGPVDLRKILYINNSVDLSDYIQKMKTYRYNDLDLDDNSFFKVVYIGSISLANDVQMLVEAAEYLSKEKKIKFFIYGDGSEREKLELYCKEKSIDNIIFKEKKIEYKFVPSLLSKSSLNILNFRQTNVLKYGGSQGKLFNYFASGKPVCANVKMGKCLINNRKLGIADNFQSADEYAEKILELANLKEEDYKEICKRVKAVAEEYDFRIQSKKLFKRIL